MSMLLVDSHCHLNFPEFKDDLEGVITRARAAGVGVMQTICTEMEEFDEVSGIAERYDGVYCSVGVHPNESEVKNRADLGELLKRTSHPKVIGIGETGLDYHYTHSSHEAQMDSFKVHINAARKSGLPLIVHSRDADEDTVGTLAAEMKKGAFTGVIHCFTSTQYLADKALELGFYISISGIVSFKTAQPIRDVIKTIPLDRLLVETDAPFLAPVPHRGKRNEPAYTRHTNKIVAELKNISEEECAAATTQNFFRLFNKATLPC
jgi:TatD DNase family protein